MTFRLYPIAGYAIEMPYRNSEGYEESETYREYDVLDNDVFSRSADAKRSSVERYLTELALSSRNVFLLYPIPETGIDIHARNYEYWNRENKILHDITSPFQDYVERHEFVIGLFDSLVAKNITRVRTDRVFCNVTHAGRCTMQHDGQPYYYDDDHLGSVGAEMLINEILRVSEW